MKRRPEETCILLWSGYKAVQSKPVQSKGSQAIISRGENNQAYFVYAVSKMLYITRQNIVFLYESRQKFRTCYDQTYVCAHYTSTTHISFFLFLWLKVSEKFQKFSHFLVIFILQIVHWDTYSLTVFIHKIHHSLYL